MTESLIKRIAIAALLCIGSAVGFLTFFSVSVFGLRGVYDHVTAGLLAAGGLVVGVYGWKRVAHDIEMIHVEIESLEEKKPGTARRLELTRQIAVALALVASLVIIVLLDKHYTPQNSSEQQTTTEIHRQ